jgi:enoyl-[acyl-carrier protein] reductase II
VQSAYQQKADVETLKSLLGRGRAKKGMFEGDMIEGELEIGQVSAGIQNIKPVAEVMQNIVTDFNDTLQRVGPMKL